MAHRQAYWPRMWPNLLLALAIGTVVQGVLWLAGVRASSALGGVVIGALVGSIVAAGYWNVMIFRWRRKHPELKPEEIVDRRRDAAPWN